MLSLKIYWLCCGRWLQTIHKTTRKCAKVNVYNFVLNVHTYSRWYMYMCIFPEIKLLNFTANIERNCTIFFVSFFIQSCNILHRTYKTLLKSAFFIKINKPQSMQLDVTGLFNTGRTISYICEGNHNTTTQYNEMLRRQTVFKI